jgi:endonuclease/exonuclease/phosphatase family metal-dependent hydrolase
MPRHTRLQMALLVGLVLTATALAEQLRVVGFNVESGGARPEGVATLVATTPGVNLWGFSEVQDDTWGMAFEQAAEQGTRADVLRVLGTTGGADRLLILSNAERLDLLQHVELHDINPQGRVRAPLVGYFRLKVTGQECLFQGNHLYRSRADQRHLQAQLLNRWARQHTLPVIALGDFNFDWSVTNGDTNHDAGYDHLTADGVFVWVRPARLLRTQCGFDSVLDCVCVAGLAQRWPARAESLAAEPSYCPDTPTTSDHRPVMATFEFAPPCPPVSRAPCCSISSGWRGSCGRCVG